MRVQDYRQHDSKKVWLSQEEVDELLRQVDDTERRIAIELMVRAGLRRKEVLDVTPQDVVEADHLYRVRVQEGKGGKYREPPIPASLYSAAHAYADAKGRAPNDSIVAASTRTVDRWIRTVREDCAERTGDEMWHELTAHDLRRTWAQLCLEAEVEAGMLMEWGGWDNWETFRENYLGAYSPGAEREQAEEVPWL